MIIIIFIHWHFHHDGASYDQTSSILICFYSSSVLICMKFLAWSLHIIYGFTSCPLFTIFIIYVFQRSRCHPFVTRLYHCILNFTNYSCSVSTFRSCLMSSFWFYLMWNVMVMSPWLVTRSLFIIMRCTYDIKVKSCNIAVKNKFSYAYSQEFPYRTNHILECEFYLLENLDCCLIVYQPYRPLLQLIQDIGQEDQLLALAWRVVNDSLRTDVCLLYPPYQIALGEWFLQGDVSFSCFLCI